LIPRGPSTHILQKREPQLTYHPKLLYIPSPRIHLLTHDNLYSHGDGGLFFRREFSLELLCLMNHTNFNCRFWHSLQKKAPPDPPKPNCKPAANGHSQPGEKRKRPGDPASQSASKSRRTGASSSRKIPHNKDGSASPQNRPTFTQKNGAPDRHGGSAPAPNRPTFTQKNGAPTQPGGPTIPKKDPLPALPRPTFIEKPKEEAQNSLESGNDYAVFPKYPGRPSRPSHSTLRLRVPLILIPPCPWRLKHWLDFTL
jgi:hypothetical protein